MEPNWFTLAVQARKERYVEQQLQSTGYTVACPRYFKTVRHARSVKQVAKPLFPGYLFVEINNSDAHWRDVNWVQGSIGLVKFDNRPTPLRREFVDDFIANLGTDGIVNFKQELQVGDRVQAVGGPFDRFMGEVIEMSDSDRIKVLMEALNRKVEMTLPRKALVVAA